MSNDETNRGKLTLSFNLSVSQVHPVKVRIESYDHQHQRTGGLGAAVYPAAIDFYQRYAVDLSTMQESGTGTFNPTDPFVSLSFVLDSAAAWTSDGRCELRVDNVQYAKPAIYVSLQGSDTNDGRTEQTALATPQKAVNISVAGDIILLMEGTYPSGAARSFFATVVPPLRGSRSKITRGNIRFWKMKPGIASVLAALQRPILQRHRRSPTSKCAVCTSSEMPMWPTQNIPKRSINPTPELTAMQLVWKAGTRKTRPIICDLPTTS